MQARQQPRTPLVIAHRGASGVAPENTCVAISTALALGADMVEIDIQLCKDDQLVVFHDAHLGRTIRCPQYSARELRRTRISDLTLATIRGLDAGSWWGPAFAAEPLPALTDVLTLCGSRIGLNIEVKLSGARADDGRKSAVPQTEERRRVVAQLWSALKSHAAVNSVVVSSFDHEALRLMRDAGESVRLGVLTNTRGVRSALAVAATLRAYSLHVPCAAVTRSLVESVHARGFKLFAYTANRAGLMRRLIAAGVDGLFTDYPDRMLNLLSDRPQH
jgi:glycerophosphoryl diester phosphodiesterase